MLCRTEEPPRSAVQAGVKGTCALDAGEAALARQGKARSRRVPARRDHADASTQPKTPLGEQGPARAEFPLWGVQLRGPGLQFQQKS